MIKKIAILTGPLAGHGGEETVIKKVVNLMSSSSQYVFEIILSENIGDTHWLSNLVGSIEQVKVNRKQGIFSKLSFVFNSLFHCKSDFIICLTPKMTLLARMAKSIFFLKYKIVTWVHFSLTEKFDYKTVKMLKVADYHLAINSEIKKQLLSMKIPENRIALVFNPVKKVSSFIPCSESIKKLICISRIQYEGEKNLSELINALKFLKDKKDWTLDIYGADDSQHGIETRKLKQLIREYGLESHVVFKGFVQNVWDSIYEADCLILTSKAEGFGMVLCEAISYGIPVISANCPSGPADIVNSKNGFLYTMGDINQLAYYIRKIVNGNVNFKREDVKASISKMYEDEYRRRLGTFLDNCL